MKSLEKVPHSWAHSQHCFLKGLSFPIVEVRAEMFFFFFALGSCQKRTRSLERRLRHHFKICFIWTSVLSWFPQEFCLYIGKKQKNVGTFQQIFLFISIIFNLKTSTNGGQVSQNLSNLADDCFFTILNKEKSYCINTYMSLLKVMKLLKYYFLGEEKGWGEIDYIYHLHYRERDFRPKLDDCQYGQKRRLQNFELSCWRHKWMNTK